VVDQGAVIDPIVGEEVVHAVTVAVPDQEVKANRREPAHMEEQINKS